jgi:hypothetical protein
MPRPLVPVSLCINAYTGCRVFVNIRVGVFFTNNCQGSVSFVKISSVTVFSVGNECISTSLSMLLDVLKLGVNDFHALSYRGSGFRENWCSEGHTSRRVVN